MFFVTNAYLQTPSIYVMNTFLTLIASPCWTSVPSPGMIKYFWGNNQSRREYIIPTNIWEAFYNNQNSGAFSQIRIPPTLSIYPAQLPHATRTNRKSTAFQIFPSPFQVEFCTPYACIRTAGFLNCVILILRGEMQHWKSGPVYIYFLEHVSQWCQLATPSQAHCPPR